MAAGGMIYEQYVLSVISAASTAAASRPADRTASSTRPAYTAPGPAAQALTFVGLTTAPGAAMNADAAARRASEAALGKPGLVSSVGPAVRASSLGGTATVQVSVGRDTLLHGSALAFGSPYNLLRPQANPVAGRCPELVGAGFFPSVSACRAYFSR